MCAVGGVRREGEVGKRDVSTDPRWIKFIATLREKGYFQVSLPQPLLEESLSEAYPPLSFPLSPLPPPSSLLPPPLRVRWKAPSCTSSSWLLLKTTSLTISFTMRREGALEGGRRRRRRRRRTVAWQDSGRSTVALCQTDLPPPSFVETHWKQLAIELYTF